MAPKPEYVCNIPVVKTVKDHIYGSARFKALELMTDLQAKVEADISGDEMIKLARHLLDCNIPESPLVTMQTLFEVCSPAGFASSCT